tara:strand:+ start:56 stop:394 length:339 start_codon:yes stop_codon:yes gene_type:complete
MSTPYLMPPWTRSPAPLAVRPVLLRYAVNCVSAAVRRQHCQALDAFSNGIQVLDQYRLNCRTLAISSRPAQSLMRLKNDLNTAKSRQDRKWLLLPAKVSFHNAFVKCSAVQE